MESILQNRAAGNKNSFSCISGFCFLQLLVLGVKYHLLGLSLRRHNIGCCLFTSFYHTNKVHISLIQFRKAMNNPQLQDQMLDLDINKSIKPRMELD
jgi:hypothetical protein